MDFVHRPYIPQETIAACATACGEGGIAIVRISGSEAEVVAGRIIKSDIKKFTSHVMHFCKIFDPESGVKIDEALVVVMRGGRSFTGEDTVEIQCHGGRLVTSKVLDAAIKAGARAALPGEFSFKAYMNGKIDLAQAEAIQALIAAKNEHALSFAQDQLEGALSLKVKEFQKSITDIAAILEAWVDFPEEDLEFQPFEEVIANLAVIQTQIKKLVETFHQGKMIHDGVSLCLVGSPNVGKSSLMNALLGKERAIVSAIAGTTRDLVEDDLRIGGLHFRLTDTAGIRKTEESIEEEGIRRSKKAIEKADLVLFVLDAHEKEPIDRELLDLLPRSKTVVVWNKIDLGVTTLPDLHFSHTVPVSAKTGQGIDILHETIEKMIWNHGHPDKNEVTITSMRHKESLQRASEALVRVIEGLEKRVSAEFVAFDIRFVLNELGTIIGTNVTEDVLSAVFSQFCIGK